MAVNFFTEDVVLPSFKKVLFKKWIKQVVEIEGCKLGEVSVVFVSDTFLLNMNNQYLNHNYFTDIITFDYSEVVSKKKIVSGDLFISTDTIEKNRLEYNVSYYNEMCRVVIHGILHLIGYKDKSKEEFDLMKRKEEECLLILETIS